MIVTVDIVSGRQRRIRAVGQQRREDLDIPFWEFQKEVRRNQPNEYKKLISLLGTTANEGPPHSVEKFRPIAGYDGLFEFKTKVLRLFCFFDEGGIIVCSTGYLKSGQKAPKRELERAQGWRQFYLEAKKSKELRHLPET